MFGNDPGAERIDVSQEFILIYGTGQRRPPGESFCSPINYSRPVDVDPRCTRILITFCDLFSAVAGEREEGEGAKGGFFGSSDAKLIGSRPKRRR